MESDMHSAARLLAARRRDIDHAFAGHAIAHRTCQELPLVELQLLAAGEPGAAATVDVGIDPSRISPALVIDPERQ